MEFDGIECREPLKDRGYQYLLRSWSEISGDPARLLEATRAAGARSGWQPYEPAYGTTAVVLLNQAQEGSLYDVSDPASADLVARATPTDDGISLYTTSNSTCEVNDQEYSQTPSPLTVSVSFTPEWTARQQVALRDGLATGHAASSAIADMLDAEGPAWLQPPPWPAQAGRAGARHWLKLVSCSTPAGHTGLQWSASTLTRLGEWEIPGTQQQIPETVERIRRAAGDDWQVALTGGAADGSDDLAEFELYPARADPGMPNLDMTLHVVYSDRGEGTGLTVNGRMYTRCVTPR